MSDKVSRLVGRVRAWPTRRKVLAGIFGAGTAGVLGGGVSFLANTPEGLVIHAIRRLLPEIDIAAADLKAYAKDFLARDERTSRVQMMGLRIAAPFLYSPAFQWMLPSRVGDLLDAYDRRILTGFLLSSDFFEAQKEGRTRVSYSGFFDPYEKPCANPLALLSADASP